MMRRCDVQPDLRRVAVAASPALQTAAAPLNSLCCRLRVMFVNRRWHAEAHAPLLLRRCMCSCSEPQKLRSLAAWLKRHGQHVRCLGLNFSPGATDTAICGRELEALLAAITAAGQVQQLELHLRFTGGLRVASWGAQLRQLRSLHLTIESSDLRVSSSLAGLTAVTQLTLEGRTVSMDAAVQLPPNAEQLKLSCSSNDELPHQVGPRAV